MPRNQAHTDTLRNDLRIRSYLTSTRGHGIRAIDAIHQALTGNPWLPRIMLTKSGSCAWDGMRLTTTGGTLSPRRSRQTAACCAAASSNRWPTSCTRPVRSGACVHWSSVSSPSSGCCQFNTASTPTTWWSASLTTGW